MLRLITSLSIILIFSTIQLNAELAISEFMASNDSTIPDEDGEFSDWIEIINEGNETIDVGGYHLTDNEDDLTQWTFPRIIIAPNSRIIVFASGKDRADPESPLHTDFELNAKGEYLALILPDGITKVTEFSPTFPAQNEDQSYGIGSFGNIIPEPLISTDSIAKYLIPKSEGELPDNWNGSNPPLNDDSWKSVSGGLGWESSNGTLKALITTDLREEMRSKNASGFFRYSFNFDSTGRTLQTLNLKTQVDDGYVAFLNGIQIASYNSPSPTNWNSKSSKSGRSDSDVLNNPSEHDLSDYVNLLNEGQNLLAIQGMNSASGGSDFLVRIELIAGMSKVGELYEGYFSNPTPGKASSDGTASGPIFSNYTKKPERPISGNDLIIEASLLEANSAISKVKMFYRVMFDEEKLVQMTETPIGSGDYKAPIPGASFNDGEMIRWRFEAIDELGLESLEPQFPSSKDSHKYVGTVSLNPSVESKLNVVETFIKNPNAAGSTSGTRGSIFYLDELYDNILFSRHGQSTGGFIKKSYNLDFNKTQRFKWHPDERRVKDIDLLTNWADKSKVRHVLAWEIMRESGVHGHFAFTVRVQQNGDFFSTADFVEDADDLYLERAGLNPDGALYKVYSNTLSSGDNGNSGVEKKNRKEEKNQDLTDFIREINSGNTGEQWDFIYDNVNLPMCVNMAAANCVIRNTDMHRKNWYIYRDTGKSDEWALLPWDLDLSQGRKWNGTDTYFDNKLFSTDVIRVGTSVSLVQKMWSRPETSQMLMRRIRTLSDKFLSTPDTPYDQRYYERRLDEQSALIDPPDITPSDARLDFVKWGSWVQSRGSSVSYTSNNRDVEDMLEGITRWKNEYLPGRRNYIYGASARLPEPQSGQLSYDSTPLIITGTESKTKIPIDGSEDLNWLAKEFDDSSWISGTTGVGFDSSPKYKPLIGTDTREIMRRINATAYVRIPFSITDSSNYKKLELLMKHDDGFIAYINGKKVAEKNAPPNPSWNSTATTSSGEADVNEFEVYDISSHLDQLRNGSNVLAIHGMNGSVGSSDFLIVPELHAGIPDSNGSNEPKIDFGDIEFNPESHDQDEEFIELKNPNDIAVDISDWSLRGAVEFNIPPGTVIPSNGTVYVSRDRKKFRARTKSPHGGEGLFVIGNYKGHLSNRGETLDLLDYNGFSNNSISYEGSPSQAQLQLVITKLHYHPENNGLSEFIEVMNVSDDQSLDLTGIHFTSGISFNFSNGSIKSLGAGERALIIRDASAFEESFGTELPIAGTFEEGTALSNGGETIKLEDRENGSISEFKYNDKSPWPESADGNGKALGLIDPRSLPDPDDPNNWVAIEPSPNSTNDGFTGDPNIDKDADGMTAFLEYAVGTSENKFNIQSSIFFVSLNTENIVFNYKKNTSDENLNFNIETSIDLKEWKNISELGELKTEETKDNEHSSTVTLTLLSSIDSEPSRHFRLKVTR
ncbi:MAG: lamin tail domain-containing protein [Verrucomicrobiales bacterium]|nr:lamin tail domain-containing protein [Verrucomicrobiales bacterium]